MQQQELCRDVDPRVVLHVVQCIQQHLSCRPRSSSRRRSTLSQEDWAAVSKRVNATAPALCSSKCHLTPVQCQAIWRTIAYGEPFELISNSLKGTVHMERTISVSKEFDLVNFCADDSDIDYPMDDEEIALCNFAYNCKEQFTHIPPKSSSCAPAPRSQPMEVDKPVPQELKHKPSAIQDCSAAVVSSSMPLSSPEATGAATTAAATAAANKRKRKWSVSLDLKLLQAIEDIAFPGVSTSQPINWQMVKEKTMREDGLQDRNADELENRWKVLQRNVRAARYKNERIIEWVQSLTSRLEAVYAASNQVQYSFEHQAAVQQQMQHLMQLQALQQQQQQQQQQIYNEGHGGVPGDQSQFFAYAMYPQLFNHQLGGLSAMDSYAMQMLSPFALQQQMAIPSGSGSEMMQTANFLGLSGESPNAASWFGNQATQDLVNSRPTLDVEEVQEIEPIRETPAVEDAVMTSAQDQDQQHGISESIVNAALETISALENEGQQASREQDKVSEVLDDVSQEEAAIDLVEFAQSASLQ
eukprot:TRINITY_DN19854_c0_g1_i1.p1 TRINITY_DN19854_c0_g1~~TRINITY_DN19854_c0_g1_i1.p1  ORF type:complete len:528 (+),score=123.75 TRINITY_DN19854_c0_g1_i1:3443-5026(+)